MLVETGPTEVGLSGEAIEGAEKKFGKACTFKRWSSRHHRDATRQGDGSFRFSRQSIHMGFIANP
jgi:hypothetical protein